MTVKTVKDGTLKSSPDKGRKQQAELDLIHDYWTVQFLLDKSFTYEEQKAYAVLQGLINSSLREMEGR